MGFYNVDDVIDAFKSGALDEYLKEFDENDLVFLLKELNGYLEKNLIVDKNQELIDEIQRRIDALRQ